MSRNLLLMGNPGMKATRTAKMNKFWGGWLGRRTGFAGNLAPKNGKIWVGGADWMKSHSTPRQGVHGHIGRPAKSLPIKAHMKRAAQKFVGQKHEFRKETR
jgi:hypothetical protein